MKYKTSCFNPGLSRDALRRFWPLPVGSFLLFFVSLVLPFYHELHSRSVELLSQYNYVSEYGESIQDVADYTLPGRLPCKRCCLPFWRPLPPCWCSTIFMEKRKFSSI